MYYSGNVKDLLESNTAIIGDRESGKTTILKKTIDYCYKNDYTILLFDSATDHLEKSILVDTNKNYKSNITIDSPIKKEIHIGTACRYDYPFSIVSKSERRIYSFDVSRYLEEGYETDNLEEREKVRLYYKQLVFQELTVMLPILSNKKCVVIMDEIEFIPCMKNVILRYTTANIPVIATFHKQESLSTSASLFDIILLN